MAKTTTQRMRRSRTVVRAASRPHPPAAPPAPGPEPAQAHGRIWHLLEGDAEVGSFTDHRQRHFIPGERLIDDAGRRRLVIAVLDEAGLRLAVSRAL